MTDTFVQSFASEIERMAQALKDIAIWPSPVTGLALHFLKLSKWDKYIPAHLRVLRFPEGHLDSGPLAAAAGYFIHSAEVSDDELARWRDGLKRLSKREAFPRDRQTFAYRPAELIGLILGILKVEGRRSAVTLWIKNVVKNLPDKNSPGDIWTLLLYRYAAFLLDVENTTPLPARLSEFDLAELGLLEVLIGKNYLSTSDYRIEDIQISLLERLYVSRPDVRDVERLSTLLVSISNSVKVQLSMLKPKAGHSEKDMTSQNKVKKILFLAANPIDENQLSLDRECREIEQRIQVSKHRDHFELHSKWAVRPEDLLQYLLQYSPHIVHFSGHGSSSDEIFLLDAQSRAMPVSKSAIKHLFLTLKDNIRVVVLNACFSQPQALAIVEIVDCAVGMSKEIGDEAAISFAASFYQAIGYGRSVREAFELGRSALLLAGISEENTPQLLVKDGVDAADVYLVG